ncbi:MAG: hypothetical protein CL666_15750 [Balneola sp.]|nr:hypothetical protein [Balneola sp.]
MEAEKRTCHYCNAEQGSLRPVGRFIVDLKTATVDGSDKQVCQSCYHKIIPNLKNVEKEKGLATRVKKMINRVFC